METLTTMFREEIKAAVTTASASTVITKDNVYQEGDERIVSILDKMAGSLMLPGSGVDGMENLEGLLAKARSGKSCLLLLEHYSNLDLSIFSLLVRQAGGRGGEIADALIAIAGAKLNEDSPVVAAFASAYTRIVIYPSSYLTGLPPEKKQVEIPRSLSINRAAMKALEEKKTQGKLVLVFPAGTRYRPWDPSTKKGVREIDSYIKSFDYMCCVALNGDILHVQKTDMMNDAVSRDVVRVTAGPIRSCAEFRERARGTVAETDTSRDKKQAVVDAIMAELDELHTEAEKKRKRP
ncbi:MAG: 1-acyl-sn-glycerol-3-phosphate acyltransferase [Treponema sp.]|nr:1-acyl-sn-glycerol-3-phosphate acyltransferase [Treponema sp.]